jgi:hypothetical protein
MGNIITYVRTELRSLADKPFNVVDSLVLSELAYIRFGDTVPEPGLLNRSVRLRDIYKSELLMPVFPHLRTCAAFPQDKYATTSENLFALLSAAAASPRFRDIRMCHYVEESDSIREQQFAAVTFLLPDWSAFIAYRGTDSSLIGWKEDFNMALLSPIPSQATAAAYLHTVGQRLPFRNRLMTGGHSKGGNLAVYAAMTAAPELQSRIFSIYNHDGPGFKTGVLDHPGFHAIQSRITKILPQSSIVGMLLADQEEYAVVDSCRFGPMQHDAFSWAVEGDDFVYAEKLTDGAEYMNRTLKAWLESLPDEQRQILIEALFQIISSSGVDSFDDIADTWKQTARVMYGQYRSLDADTKKKVSQLTRSLLKMAVKNLRREKALKEKGSAALPSRKVTVIVKKSGAVL